VQRIFAPTLASSTTSEKAIEQKAILNKGAIVAKFSENIFFRSILPLAQDWMPEWAISCNNSIRF
jgi:hypothetical protein